ncbi:hypothetical protein ACFFJI_04970 [Allobacillus sp. GCM10007491]|uniref:Uncharacterized protein n=1 Tax=Allobacillus saliphilus TaxID=2912308 RepID=A0A941CXV9_9BACI|nr:hypothetical protein [Allobacillus saliphilus]MBR7554100.1 hypothetical protein [Allobacillus saliphilus]
MGLVVLLIFIFIISISLIFPMVFKGERKEATDEKASMWLVSFVSTLLALLITAIFGGLSLVLLGALNVANIVLSIDVSSSKLIVLTVCYFIYLFTIETVFDTIINFFVSIKLFQQILLALVRILVFGLIASLVGLSYEQALLIATGSALVLLVIELLYDFKQKPEKPSH